MTECVISTDDLRLVGRGATADVFLLDDVRVLKLFHKDFPEEAVQYEADIAYAINGVQVSAPKILDVVKDANSMRFGIVYEYVNGSNLFDELIAKRNYKELIHLLVETQVEITMQTSSKLPKQYDRFMDQINRSDLSDKTKSVIASFLLKHSADCFVCHGDYHVGNIMRVDNRLVVLDWMNAYCGNAATDFIRSILMLDSPYIPVKLNMFQVLFFMRYKRRLARLYKKEVLSRVQIPNYAAWLVVVAAVRLADNVPHEERWLKKIIRQNIGTLA